MADCEPQVITTGDYNAYAYPDQLSSQTLFYRSPGAVISPRDEATAQEFAATVRVSMPFFLPYRDAQVTLGAGWYYSTDNLHAAADYSNWNSRDEPGFSPSFEVYAVADGEVRSVLWDEWAGNVVIIEHTAANGDRYQSLYCHMRNGFSHDLAAAQAIPVNDANHPKLDSSGNTTNWFKYSQFATLTDFQTAQLWGTEEQTIQVSAGDTVFAGQLIGWSGNTGAGGAGNGLNADGTPVDAQTANGHLHLFIAVPDPGGVADNWVLIDPYGVYRVAYEGDNTSCYDLGKPTKFVRLFAPFYSSFHNLPLDILLAYWAYYPGMGMALQTISVYWGGGQLLCAGSFQFGLSADWYALLYLTFDEFQQEVDAGVEQGYLPREMSVVIAPDGSPRYNAIWMPWGNGAYSVSHMLTDAGWDSLWNQKVGNEQMRVLDHFTYEVEGTTYHTAVFIGGSDTAFSLWEYMSPAEFQSKFNELYADGFYPVGVNAAELSSGTYYGGIWRPLPHDTLTWVNLSAQQYQDTYLQAVGAGLRLYKVQGYNGGNTFAAVWGQ
jgi:hypothetical protein